MLKRRRDSAPFDRLRLAPSIAFGSVRPTDSRSRSRALSPREVRPDLSTCPPAAESGQVDRLLPTSQEDYEAAERAVIVEHDGRILREWAEGYARLDPDRSPGDVPPRSWRQFIDDTRLFLNGGFAERAVALGWGSHDLFGCDRDRPFTRIDQAGLCWLIVGNRLVDISESAATIETKSGVRQRYRRKPSEPGRVPAWELEQ